MGAVVDWLTKELKKLSAHSGGETPEWLSSAESSVEFLKAITQSDTLVLFASMHAVLIHAVLAPLENLDPPDQDDLNHAFVMPDDAWGIDYVSGGGEADRVYLAPPLDRRSKTLRGGEKLFFRRWFAGSKFRPVEISQKLVHALDLHFIEERSAYCRLDANGDLEDVIRVIEEKHEDWTRDVTIVTMLTRDFTEYMRLAAMGMVIFFDFTRTRRGSFSGWSDQERFDRKTPDLFYHGGVMAGYASYVNGRMVVRPTVTYDEIVNGRIEKHSPKERDYATFKTIDLKTGKRIEASRDPNALSNYFQPESTLPRQMSPVFFRAEILHKYKADPEKYDLQDRTIRCRGTWSLKTFDINDAGQVHTYIGYLGELPFSEQVYWLSFNEWPKASLSERAFTNDFKGEIYYGHDPLNSLKRMIIRLDETKPAWWHPRGEELRKAVLVPATSSPTEWANEILALDHLVNEGFRLKQLRAVAQKLGRPPEADWKVFKLLEECLKCLHVQETEVKTAISGLRSVRDLRNVLKGHPAIEKRREIERQARTKFGSFRAHFEDLTANADAALNVIVSALVPSDGSLQR